jgi:CubicO group peptidase (beta-lactamase class C family)
VWALVLALVFAWAPAAAQQLPNVSSQAGHVQQVVNEFIQPYLIKYKIPGAIVGVSVKGQRYFFPYGKATDAGAAFTSDTLVEIGSCTKVFTTTIFAMAINDGQIAPTVSAQTYMPHGYVLQLVAQRVTPLELADFTSGIPDVPTNLPPGLENRSVAHYTKADFLKWAAAWNPSTPPPAPYKYSNAGIGLLSYLVTDATGKPWESQLKSEILGPLAMKDTVLRPSPEQHTRLSQGHYKNGSDAPPWPIYAWFAGGGLRSTAQDMLTFGEANLGQHEVGSSSASDPLFAAMQLAQKPIYQLPSGENEQGMAWVTEPGDPSQGSHPVILKDGGTDGFSTVIIINPSKDLALFIGVNKQGTYPSNPGVVIARHL